MTIRIRSWHVATALASVTLIFATINLICFSFYGADLSKRSASFRLFDMTDEANIASFFSALVLMAAALAAAANIPAKSRNERRRPRPWLPGWRALAVIFVFLAVDEAAQIHEQFSRFKIGASGNFAFLDLYTWVFIYMPVTALLGVAFVPFLRGLPSRTAGLIVLAGALYVVGAVGLELVGAWQRVAQGLSASDLSVVLRSIGEETTETLGIMLFVGAVLEHAAGARVAIGFQILGGARRMGTTDAASLTGAEGLLSHDADRSLFSVTPREIEAKDASNTAGRRGRRSIDLDDYWALEYWSRKWGVSGEQIKVAVVKVGPMADDVAAELGDALYYTKPADRSRSRG